MTCCGNPGIKLQEVSRATLHHMQDPKGKGRASEVARETQAIEIIFGLLRSQLTQRSTSHLLLSLSLLEIVLETAKPITRSPLPRVAAARTGAAAGAGTSASSLPAVPEEGEPAQSSGAGGNEAAQDPDTNMDGELSYPASCGSHNLQRILRNVSLSQCPLAALSVFQPGGIPTLP